MEPSDFSITSQFAFALELSLGLIFLTAVVSKLMQPRGFAETMVEYDVIPAKVARLLSVLVIAVESFLAFAFLTGWFVYLALPLAFVTLTAFFTAVAVNLRRGQLVRCGCFGNRDEQISARGLVRLVLLLGGLTILLAITASGASQIRMNDLIADGTATVAYLVEIASVTAFVILAGLWLLHGREIFGLAVTRGAGGSSAEKE